MNIRQRLTMSALCFGLFSLSPSASHAGSYKPLDCSEASKPADVTVCNNYELGQDEARQATLFAILTSLVAMGQRANLIEEQKRWITSREACEQDVKCLSSSYKTHIEDLSKGLDELARRGPF